MRTARLSGDSGGGCTPSIHTPRWDTHPSCLGVYWDTHHPAQVHAGIHPLPWTDRCLWKHYLPATSFAGGNYVYHKK